MHKQNIYNINPEEFWMNPYPDLQIMRREKPIAYVPELNAILFTKRQSIFENEKKIEIFSSDQPDGLMTKLMGENMMRKDGEAHLKERKAIFPSISPKTTKLIWREKFDEAADDILSTLEKKSGGDLVKEYAMPLSAEALKVVTGLTNMDRAEMDRVSQGMIDGIANYSGDPKVERNCKDCTASIDSHIDEITGSLAKNPDYSLLSIQMANGLSENQIRSNIKLAISGGQNEPRDAIAGTIWALLNHPKQLNHVINEKFSWLDAFEEFARWISPIGMSPRRVAKPHRIGKMNFLKNDRVFFMFGSGNRDEECFEYPDQFNIAQDRSNTITFGAGPHFCAGAWISRCLIGEVALPKLFKKFHNLKLRSDSPVEFRGWAFRGPLKLDCSW